MMINLRLVALIIYLLLVPVSAWAANAPDYPATITNFKFNGSPARPNAETACMCVMDAAGCAPKLGAVNKAVYVLEGPANITASHNCKIAYTNGTFSGKLGLETYFSCPYGGTGPAYMGSATTSVVMCTNVPVGGGPPPDDPCSDKNPMIRRYNYGLTGPYTSPDNFAGCVVTPVEMMACHKSATGSFCYWKIVRTGDKYTGPANDTSGGGSQDVTPPPTVPPPVVPSPPIQPPKPSTPDVCSTCVPCPAGTVQAGISASGIPMCVGTGTNPPPPATPPPTTVKSPVSSTGTDGTVTKVQESTQNNSDGSVTTTTTTTVTKPDGSVSVSQSAAVTPSAAGSPGRTDGQPSDDKTNFCKQNPTLSICRESSVSGTCGQITCTGDAIQCSTLRAAAAMQCKMQEDEDALKAMPARTLGDQILSGADPMKGAIDAAIKGETVDFGAEKMDQSGFLGGGSCIAPKTFHFFGKSHVMDFATACDNAQPARFVILGLAFIVAYLIVSKSVLDS